MAKKILISFSVVFGFLLAILLVFFVFSTVAAEYSADAAAQLEQAKAYEAEGNYEQAEAIYRSIATDYPGTDEAFHAQKNLALLFITTHDYPEAQEQVDALITDFPQHPQLSGALYDIANQYWYRRGYQQARALYQFAADNKADSEHAFKGRVWVVGCDFMLDDSMAAWQGLDALAKDFTGNPDLPKMIYDIAYSCWRAVKFEYAQQLYIYMFENMPDSGLAFQAQAWATAANIRLGNYALAQQEIDGLITDFAGHPELPRVIYKLANEYWHMWWYEDAKQLYESVLEMDPNGDLAVWAKAWVTGSALLLSNSISPQHVIDTLIKDCNGHPGLAEIIYGNANACWYFGKYEQARQLYNYIVDNIPDSEFAARAQAWVAGCDIQLGNYDAAQQRIDALITDYAHDPELPAQLYQLGVLYWNVQRHEASKQLNQHIVDNWPDDRYAGEAQFLIGYYYETSRSLGLIPESAANPKIEQAYKAVIEKYPYTDAVRGASIGLGWLNFKKGQWLQAARYWELSLSKSGRYDKPLHILYPLGRAYEEIGQVDKAEQLYNQFVNVVPPIDPRIETVKARLEKLGTL